jgi:hypothetical protein
VTASDVREAVRSRAIDATVPAPVREAIGATVVQTVAVVAHAVTATLVFLIALVGSFGAEPLRWASLQAGAVADLQAGAVGEAVPPSRPYLAVASLIVVLASLFVRVLHPNPGDSGMSRRAYRRTLREDEGIRLLLAAAWLRTGVVVLSVLWAVLGVIAVSELNRLDDAGHEIGGALYAGLVLVAVGLASAIAVWPWKAESLYMDRIGGIIRR